jgi:hypothetical protein
VVDPVTDMATLPYLTVRLKAIYAAAAATGRPVSRTHCLLVVETALVCTDPWLRLQRGLILGRVFRETFAEGQPLVSLGPRSGAALVVLIRDHKLGHTVRQTRAALNEAMSSLQEAAAARHPVRAWVESLPKTYEMALSLLGDLSR